jgi:hypothetical protein
MDKKYIILFLLVILLFLLILIYYYEYKFSNKKSILNLEYFRIKASPIDDSCLKFYSDYYTKYNYDKKKYKERKINNEQNSCIRNINLNILERVYENSPNLIQTGECETNTNTFDEEEKIKNLDSNICYKNPPFEYHRDYFVNSYDDVNNDSCDTRSEILAKYNEGNLTYHSEEENDKKCIIDKGLWNSYFTYHYDKGKLSMKPITDAKIYSREQESDNFKLNLDENDNLRKECNQKKLNEAPNKLLTFMLDKNNIFKNYYSSKFIGEEYNKASGSKSQYNSNLNKLKENNCVIQAPNKITKLSKPENVLDIDHIVPLKNAWYSGAWKWKPWQLYAYANDMTPGHLEITPAQMNRSKSDSSFDEWKPTSYNKEDKYKEIGLNNVISNEADCEYAANYISIKHRWNLGITDDEYNSLKSILKNENCGIVLPKHYVDLNKLGKSYKLSEDHPNLLKVGITDKDETKYKNIKDIQNKYKKYCFSSNSDINNNLNLKKDIFENKSTLELWNVNHFDNLLNTYEQDKQKKVLCQTLFKNVK